MGRLVTFQDICTNKLAKAIGKMTKKYIALAYGTGSKMLYMYLQNTEKNPFKYCITSLPSTDQPSRLRLFYRYCKRLFRKERRNWINETISKELPIVDCNFLKKEDGQSIVIVIFTVSNEELRECSSRLNKMDFRYKEDFIFYSDFLFNKFCCKFYKAMGWYPDIDIYKYALSFNLNSVKPVHTTILGNLTFLELLKKAEHLEGDIAEVGAYEGGNVLCALNFMSSNGLSHGRKYYVFDSFEGFPELGKYDPTKMHKKGEYVPNKSLQEIYDSFRMFSEAKVIKGFVPDSFKQIPENSKFSLVFYDCDLYRPAVDTFEYFWNKIVDGGYLIIHDYMCPPGEFEGVRRATDEFFQRSDMSVFFESTMAIIKKHNRD